MRLIDADPFGVIFLQGKSEEFIEGVMFMLNKIDEAPTTEERPHGEWIEKPWGVVCSRCKAQALHTPNGNQSRSDYCPDCGADMRRKEGDEK